MSDTQIVIVGAGVIGLSLAYELSGRGARVVVLDRGEPGRACSWAGAGILTPARAAGARRAIDRLRAASHERIERWSAELLAATGIDNEYRRCGALELALTPAELPALERAAADWREQGVAIAEVTAAELTKLEPALTPGLARAYLLPDGAQIRNPRHLRALVAGCRQRGVEVRAGAEVTGFETLAGGEGGRVAAVVIGGGQERIRGDAFVAAGGAWSAALLAAAGVEVAVRPVRGQIVLLHPPLEAMPLLHRVLWRGSRYLVPRLDGRVLVGSTEEEAGFDAVPTAAGVAGLLELALAVAPGLAAAPFERAWAGLRPGSVDGLPYLGAAPGFANLYVAAGHFRAGFELSAGTALVMAELILGAAPSVPLADFRPDRTSAAGGEASHSPVHG